MAPAIKSIKLNRKGGVITAHASTTFLTFHIFGADFALTYTYNDANPSMVSFNYEILEEGRNSSFPFSSIAHRLTYFDQDNQKFYILVSQPV